MKLSKLIFAGLGCTFMVLAFAQQTPVDMEEGTSAMQIALQKELYGILISDTDEVQSFYRKEKLSYKNDSMISYENILKEICKKDNAERCPEMYLTSREGKGVVSMGPTGILSLHEEMIKRIDMNEATFIIAHEYAHYKFNHSKQRMKVIAQSVSDHAIMIREPEQALDFSMFFPNVREAHYDYENQADIYGFNYIHSLNIKINCEEMFLKLLNGEIISTDKHETIAKRCENYKG